MERSKSSNSLARLRYLRPFFLSTGDEIGQAKEKYLVGASHELAEEGALTLVPMAEVEDFHKFKGRFEWLERRFGLRPR